MARVTRVKADWVGTSFYGGLLDGRKRPGTPRTFTLEFTTQSERLRRELGKAYQGRTDDEKALFDDIFNREIQRLFDKNLRKVFRDEAPEDPTDSQEWNSEWWSPPTLRESIMKSPLIKSGLRKGNIELLLRMRWYGQLTIEGRRGYFAEHMQKYMLKSGRWVTVPKGGYVGPSTMWNDLLTDEDAETRMNWAGRAYYKSIPYIAQTRKVIASRILEEAIVMNFQAATAAMVREQARAARQAELNIFRRNL